MQENDFEKQAKKLMDDLRIDPSEPVWNYVEKRIPKSNRRRRFIAFFFLFAGLAVCGYVAYNRFYAGNYKNTVLVLEDSNATVKKQSSQPKEKEHNEVVINEENKSETTNKTTQVKEEIAKNKIGKSSVVKNEEAVIFNTKKEDSKSSADQTIYKDEDEFSTVTAITLNDVLVEKKSITTQENIGADESKGEITKSQTLAQQEDSLKNESVKVDSLQKEEVNAETKKSKPEVEAAVNKKIQFGITALYGKSDVIEKLSIGSFGADKALYDGNFSTPGMGNGNGSAERDSIRYENSAKNVKAKSSFSIGLTMRKSLGKRSSISTGIEYIQMKTLIQTGILKDSGANFSYNNSSIQTSLSNYYTAGGNVERINTYNFIRIPFFFTYQLNNSKRFLLKADGGFSYARLISANALVYDSYNQAYYKNNDIYNKTQWQFLLGVNAEILLKNKSSVLLGPQMQYSLSGVSKNYTTQQHFFAWGLQARYYLKK